MSIGYRICKYLWDRPWFRPEYGRYVYKRICEEGEAPDAPFSTDFFGLRYEGNLRNTIDFSIFYHGAFEKPLLFFLRDCLLGLGKEQPVFCDIGANIGQHSLFMSRLAHTVHAFEPYDKVRDRLLHQIRLNDIRNVVVHPVGLSDRRHALPFFAPTGRNQGIGSFDASTVEKGNEPIGELDLAIADDYFPAHGIDAVHLVKIDVEGFEKAVLQGMQEVLARQRPVVVVEVTYGKTLSIGSLAELQDLLPENYAFLSFDTRKADGSKARRRGARAKRSGYYRLIPFDFGSARGQDNIVACPAETLPRLPLSTPTSP